MCDGSNCYFSFWANFCLFTSLTARKIKIQNKWKKCLKISSFYDKVPVSWSYPISFLRYGVWRMYLLFSILGYFLPFYSPKNQNFTKMKKTPGDTIILHMRTKNYDQMMYGSWDMVCNRQMDGQKKWHIEVGTPPRNWTLINCISWCLIGYMTIWTKSVSTKGGLSEYLISAMWPFGHQCIPYSRKLTRHKINNHEIKTKEINTNAYDNLWKRI